MSTSTFGMQANPIDLHKLVSGHFLRWERCRNVVIYYLVIVIYKMDKLKELESRMDKFLDLESRKQCLLELHSFALEQLGRYRGMNKDKQHYSLLELPSKGEGALEDAIKFYIEQQYYCYCQYLRECLDDVDKEWVEIGIKNGYIDSNKDEKS